MRKLIIVVFILLVGLQLVSCDQKEEEKEGLFPYQLTESDKELVKNIGLINKTKIIEYRGPEQAISLNVHVYTLDENGQWIKTGGSGISLGLEKEAEEILKGNLSMVVNQEHSLDCFINDAGQARFDAGKVLIEDVQMSSYKFLDSDSDIELNQETPVAILLYDRESALYTFALEDYYEPSKFADYDLVRAITMEFTDKEF